MRFSEVVQTNKEDDLGRWLLSYTSLLKDSVVLRLPISIGSHRDWHMFQADMQTSDEKPTVLGTLDIANSFVQVLLLPSIRLTRSLGSLSKSRVYRPAFEMMVREIGGLRAGLLPV
jgi:hypothetical protein